MEKLAPRTPRPTYFTRYYRIIPHNATYYHIFFHRPLPHISPLLPVLWLARPNCGAQKSTGKSKQVPEDKNKERGKKMKHSEDSSNEDTDSSHWSSSSFLLSDSDGNG